MQILKTSKILEQTQNKKLRVIFETSKNFYSLRDKSVLDGLYNAKTNTMQINHDLKILTKILTFYHETFHYMNHKAFNLRATPILNNLIDVANFLIEKNNLKALVKARFGFKSLLEAIRLRIKEIDYLEALTNRINQLKRIYEQ